MLTWGGGWVRGRDVTPLPRPYPAFKISMSKPKKIKDLYQFCRDNDIAIDPDKWVRVYKPKFKRHVHEKEHIPDQRLAPLVPYKIGWWNY